jgi:uncharacterized membrane protein YqiK
VGGIGIAVLIGFGAIIFIIVFFGIISMMLRCYHKIEMGEALIINRRGKRIDVTFTGGVVYPIVNKGEVMDISVKAMEIDRRGREGLICRDNIRADIKVTFYVRVNQTEEDVLRVAQSVGCERASKQETLNELFSAKFSEALKTVGKQMDFTDLFTERNTFKERIREVIGQDLNGYCLEDVAIDYLEQTPLESLDPDNILDAQGIRKIVDLTAVQAIETNDRQRHKERVIKQQDVETREKVLELERQQAEAEARQLREVQTLQARETAETQRVQAEQELIAEKAKIATDEQVAIANENKDRQIVVARKNKERTEAIETERVKRDQELERTERERLVAVKVIEKEKDVEVERKKIAEVIRERVNVERTVAEEEEKIKDTREIATAERSRRTEIIAADRDAEEKLIETTKAAAAKAEAAKSLYEEATTLAEAEKMAAERKAEAKKLLAEGTIAEAAATGLAEVKVKEARARAIELEGRAEAVAATEKFRAEAYGIEAKGLAEGKALEAMGSGEGRAIEVKGVAEGKAVEAKGLGEATAMRAKFTADAEGTSAKADAMRKLDEAGRGFEEFKLRLAKTERVELAAIDVNRAIGEYQAQVLAEAMKSAKIEMVGGDGQFMEQFFKSISLAKAVDGMVDHSRVMHSLTDGGDGKVLVQQLRSLIGESGLKPGDLKDLSVAALLGKLAMSKDNDIRKRAKALKDSLQNAGLDQLGLDNLAGEWLAKNDKE